MERKTAVAAATGVSMAVLSATFAVAAGVGALGFGSAAHPAQPVATTVAATARRGRNGAGRRRSGPLLTRAASTRAGTPPRP